MRDVNRIDKFMAELGKIWKEKFPDWRFGQFMYNLISYTGDPFFLEEDMFIKKVKEFAGISD